MVLDLRQRRLCGRLCVNSVVLVGLVCDLHGAFRVRSLQSSSSQQKKKIDIRKEYVR